MPLLIFGTLNILLAVLFSIRHWRDRANEMELPLRINTRKFIGRAITVFTAETFAFLIPLAALVAIFVSDQLRTLNGNGERFAEKVRNSHALYISRDRTYCTDELLQDLCSIEEFCSVSVSPELYRYPEGTRIPAVFPVKRSIEWTQYTSAYGFPIEMDLRGDADTGYPAAEKLLYMEVPKSTPLPRWLRPVVSSLTDPEDFALIEPRAVKREFAFSQKLILRPVTEEQRASYYWDNAQRMETNSGFNQAQREGYLQTIRSAPLFRFVLIGTEAVDRYLEQFPDETANVYLLSVQGTYSPVKLALSNAKLRVMELFTPVAMFYAFAVAAFVYINNKILNAREKRLLAKQRRLVQDVAHELKTPMGVVRMLCENILLEEDPKEKEKEAEQLIEQVDFMNARIVEVLDASRMESTEVKLNLQPVSLREIAEAQAEVYEPLLEERGLTLATDFAADAAVQADPRRIQQVVANLLSNAIKYAWAGSKITIRLRQEKRWIVLSIRNDCEAIPQKELAGLWDAFTKLKRDGDSALKGTGLGLSIVKSIVLLHKGKYGARCVPDGVEFWFALPMGQGRRKAKQG